MALYTVFFNWCRQHKTLRVSPAMAADLTDTLHDAEWIVGLADTATRSRDRAVPIGSGRFQNETPPAASVLDNPRTTLLWYVAVADEDRSPGPRGADVCDLRRAWWALARRIRRESLRGKPQRPRAVRFGGGRGGASGAESATAFSDEVALGFPSMDGLVAGIRASFFGRDPDAATTHTTQVALTPRQAHRGAQVPLAIEMRHTCPLCGGRGEFSDAPCGVCGGSGSGLLPQQLRLRVPPGVRHGARLRFSVTSPYAAETRVEVRIAVH